MRHVLCFSVFLPLLTAASFSQTPATLTIVVWRTKVLPGESTMVWQRAGQLDRDAWTLGRGSLNVKLAPSTWAKRGWMNVAWNWNYSSVLTIPAATPLGTWELRHKGQRVTSITVERPARGRTLHKAPQDVGWLQGDVEDDGPKRGDVIYLSGNYRLTKPLVLPEGVTIRGPAVLHREGDGHFIGVNSNCTFEDITFQADSPGGDWALNTRPIFAVFKAENVTLRRCTIRAKLVLGEFEQPGLLLEDCTFDHAGTGLVTAGAFVRCRFNGHVDPIAQHAFLCWRSDGLALIDCDFRETDRGPIFQTTRGHIQGCLITGTVMDGLSHTQGGCEGIAAENPQGKDFEFSDNLILHTRYRGDAMAFLLWTCKAHRNLIRDLAADGGSGIWLASWQAEQNDNVLQEIELRGGQLFLGLTTRRTLLPTVTVIPQTTRANGHHAYAPPSVNWVAVVDEGTANESAKVQVRRKDEAAVER